ncbi:DoxX-like family protein [Paenibacillus sinopodophylli]|uniref:DoxX-like family protein n=1 Tax=Paenibacillus sinopodophylli TaxID=1837342 RepID=UPI00110CC82E|nr:DoxX-like family protein [Paenibacillus sinopodophylli]
MRRKPIFVELVMQTSFAELWKHTQIPELHEQWDLRFSAIDYLPRTGEAQIQTFRYTTRIGFGLQITGTGETSHTSHGQNGEHRSTLSFSSAQPLSLISSGGGYWKYEEKEGKLRFSTLFDYKTRFGVVGWLVDLYLFRPLFSYATAWSFDRLRIWLEEKVPPSVIAERAMVHYLCVIALMLLWIFEGIVPKLLFPETGELPMLQQLGWFTGFELQLIKGIGILEIIIGILTVCLHRQKRLFYGQIALLLLLSIPMIAATPYSLTAPFNPLTLSVPMIVLCFVSIWSIKHLPLASRCIRRFKSMKRKEGE